MTSINPSNLEQGDIQAECCRCSGDVWIKLEDIEDIIDKLMDGSVGIICDSCYLEIVKFEGEPN